MRQYLEVFSSPRNCVSEGRGEALGQTQHAKEDYSRTSYSLGHSKHKYTSVQLEWGLSTGWVRLAQSLFTLCSGGQDCLFVVHL